MTDESKTVLEAKSWEGSDSRFFVVDRSRFDSDRAAKTHGSRFDRPIVDVCVAEFISLKLCCPADQALISPLPPEVCPENLQHVGSYYGIQFYEFEN